MSISELREGNLLLLAENKLVAEKFIKAKELTGIYNINVKYQENLNSTKGTVYAPYLRPHGDRLKLENTSPIQCGIANDSNLGIQKRGAKILAHFALIVQQNTLHLLVFARNSYQQKPNRNKNKKQMLNA